MYEYKVIPAPSRADKAKGLKTPEDRFAHTLEAALNQMAAEGWAYVRADTLPSAERSGLTQTVTQWRTVLVFRRAVPQPAPQAETPLLAAPTDADADEPDSIAQTDPAAPSDADIQR